MAKPKKVIDEARARLYAALDKKVGEGLGRLLPEMVYEPIERISTGSVMGDYVTAGGIPYGKLTEIYGPPSGGKSALAMRILGNVQRTGQKVALIDAEHAFDPEWAQRIGLDPENVFLLWPTTAEQAVRGILTYLEHGVRALVLDSIPSMRTEAELKGDVAEAKIGEGPRLWSKALPRITTAAVEANCAVILLNQVRANIGGPNYMSATSGGFALKHAYTLRMELTGLDRIKEGGDEIGFYSQFRVWKNRGPMGRRGKIPFLYGVGFSPELEVLDLGVKYGLITRAGSWYSYETERMGQGQAAACEWLHAHPALIPTLQEQLTKCLSADDTPNEPDISDDT